MDQHKLRTLVFEKTGVKIDVDDPIFALVALNEAVLAEAVERHVALIDDATADLADQIALLQESGVQVNTEARAERPALLKPAPAPARGTLAPQEKRALMLAGGAAVLGALLVLFGQALLFKAPPAPPPVLVAKELTAEQSAALRDFEKLNRIVQKLDAKTRNAIAAEMQKP